MARKLYRKLWEPFRTNVCLTENFKGRSDNDREYVVYKVFWNNLNTCKLWGALEHCTILSTLTYLSQFDGRIWPKFCSSLYRRWALHRCAALKNIIIFILSKLVHNVISIGDIIHFMHALLRDKNTSFYQRKIVIFDENCCNLNYFADVCCTACPSCHYIWIFRIM